MHTLAHPSSNREALTYRRDIDGLRALAVLPVLLFHAKVPFFSGGYIGVDIFFVISGYLITAIISREITQNRFSIAYFYNRRALRILPALTVMVAATFIGSFFTLTPDDFVAFSSSVASTALFCSNFLFWQQSGYFDVDTELKPLLHTWSLSVEEQFYLLFPLILAGAARLRMNLGLVVWCGLLASLVASIIAVRSDTASAFYLVHSRTWELLAGAAVALGAVPALRSPAAREIGAWLGVALIAFSVHFYQPGMEFPGERALLPCLGAVLVIMTGRDGPPTRMARVLSLRPLVFVGLISYSLYLWHWPIIVLMKYWTGDGLSALQSALAIAVSLAAASLSWRFVERPFRAPKVAQVTRTLVRAGAATAAMAGVGALGIVVAGETGMHGFYGSEISALQRDARPIEAGGDCVNLRRAEAVARNCLIGAPDAAPTVALVGDSFAGSLMAAVDAAFRAHHLSALPYIWYSCPSIVGTSRTEAAAWAPGFVTDCRAYVAATMAEIEADPRIRFVIFSNNYDWYLNRVSSINGEPILTVDGEAATGERNAAAIGEKILATVGRLAGAGKTVLFVGASPTGHVRHGARARLRARMKGAVPEDAVLSPEECRDATAQIGRRAQTALGERFVYLDVLRFFLGERQDGKACLMVAAGVPRTTDGSHLTSAISNAIAVSLSKEIRRGDAAGLVTD